MGVAADESSVSTLTTSSWVPEFHEFSTEPGRGLLEGGQVKAHAHAGR